MQHRSELLALLAQRYTDLGLGDGDRYRKPRLKAAERVLLDRAARLYARVHWTDPFAFGRIRLHMLQGYEAVADVIKEATAKLAIEKRSTI